MTGSIVVCGKTQPALFPLQRRPPSIYSNKRIRKKQTQQAVVGFCDDFIGQLLLPLSKLMSIEQVTRALDFTHTTVQRVRLEILVPFTSARTDRSQMRVLTSADPYERHCYRFRPGRGPLCTPQRDQQAAAVSTRTRIDLIIRSAACSGERGIAQQSLLQPYLLAVPKFSTFPP